MPPPRRVTGRLHSSTATADSRPDNAAPSPPKPSHPSSRSCSGLSSRSPWAGPPGALAAVLTDRREMQARHVNLVGTAWNDMGGRDRVMLSMPPRHGKSRRASRWGPLWFLRKYLRRRVLIGWDGQSGRAPGGLCLRLRRAPWPAARRGRRGPAFPRGPITADRFTGSLIIRVVVTGAEGTASLEADGQGKVVRRAPA